MQSSPSHTKSSSFSTLTPLTSSPAKSLKPVCLKHHYTELNHSSLSPPFSHSLSPPLSLFLPFLCLAPVSVTICPPRLPLSLSLYLCLCICLCFSLTHINTHSLALSLLFLSFLCHIYYFRIFTTIFTTKTVEAGVQDDEYEARSHADAC
jgi:hypothetical protein